MTPQRFDLVVIGASFAGLACARAAAQAGLRVAVVEKKSSSGDKLHTTGIIVKDAIDTIPWLQQVPAALVRQVDGVRLYSPNLRHVDLHAPGYYFWATDTPALLDWMCASVQADGVTLLAGTLFESAARDNGGWSVSVKSVASQEPAVLQAGYLVGADGPHSRVAKALGLSLNTQFLFGIEHEYGQARLDANLLHCFIDRKLAPGYIGWAVAGVGIQQIGLARRMSASGVPPKQAWMDSFTARIAPHVAVGDAEPLATRAGMIPCGGVLKRVSDARVMLVGDAAGMVSPVTAGGIHTALEHGDAVGGAVAAFLQAGAADGGDPADPMRGLVRNYPKFRAKRTLRWLFDHFQADWIFNLALDTEPMRQAARMVYFHRRGKPE
ncbi:NAD(P)/FAD-dependent oxidoreductase [Polaromonas sp. JS666]|uniref:NAD(P)/FAD-dependent oxidoreductase n=1 Tax=Polaromonas sp. (strain JS666 / ATCC BAA-500) TaxID=296591 RepID=UPI00088F3420|nr:NAD(P)/FAD-dependent oxidoreductase [Polaromonas sp. JS666]SDM35219.1 Dehydrogenase (flavoprotein) [Polaromonas sp. JS666]